MNNSRKNIMPVLALITTVIYLCFYSATYIGGTIESRPVTLAGVVVSLISALVLLVFIIIHNIRGKDEDFPDRINALGNRYLLFILLSQIIPFLFQLLIIPGIPALSDYIENNTGRASLILTVLVFYMIDLPILFFAVRKIPKMKIEERNLGFLNFMIYAFIMAGLASMGSMVGTPIHLLLTVPFSSDEASSSQIVEIMTSISIYERIIVMGLIGPAVEELIFRKLLIDRSIKYGEFFSIMLSGVLFGLFHGNFQQLFFASLAGFLFAYIYIRTGRIRYTIFLHMLMNLTTSIFTVSIYMKALPFVSDIEAGSDISNEGYLYIFLLLIWMMFLFAVAVTGIVLLCLRWKRFKIYKAPNELSRSKIIGKTLAAPLMLSVVILCLAEFATTYLPDMFKFFMG